MNSALFSRSRMALLVGFALSSLLLNGCGGSGHGNALSPASPAPASSHVAQATIMVKWPARPKATGIAPRLIPLASNSIKLEITQGTHSITTHTFTRPSGDQALTSSYTFGDNNDALPVGSLTVTAKAYPSLDGTGIAQASGSYDLVTSAGKNAPITINMGSTIDHLGITPASPTVDVGTTTPLTVTAYNAAGDMVLMTASKVQWSSSAPNVASVDANSGVATSIAVGSSVLTVTESESGMIGTTTILVTGSGVGGSIDHITLVVTGPDPAVHLQWTATAYNASGIVLTDDPLQFVWSSSDTSIITVDAYGRGTSTPTSQVGQHVTITAIDPASGKSATGIENVVYNDGTLPQIRQKASNNKQKSSFGYGTVN